MTLNSRFLRQMLPMLLIQLLALSNTDVREANEAYREGNYERAAELYEQAIAEEPENARLYFNLGNAFAQLNRTEESNMAFERYRELTEDAGQQALADYNIGKLYSDQEQLEEAAEHYREALIKNPNDGDARHNYELAKRLLEQQEQQEQEEDGDQDQQDENDDGENREEDEEQNGDNNEQEQDGQDGDDQQNSGGQNQQEQQSNEQQQQPQMNMDEAQSILDALDQQERELLRNRQKEAENSTTDDRNW